MNYCCPPPPFLFPPSLSFACFAVPGGFGDFLGGGQDAGAGSLRGDQGGGGAQQHRVRQGIDAVAGAQPLRVARVHALPGLVDGSRDRRHDAWTHAERVQRQGECGLRVWCGWLLFLFFVFFCFFFFFPPGFQLLPVVGFM